MVTHTHLKDIIESVKPVKQVHYRGAATFNMTMQILDMQGNIAHATAGPFRIGNKYSEHMINVPEKVGQRFMLRFRNTASTWFYIEKLTLK